MNQEIGKHIETLMDRLKSVPDKCKATESEKDWTRHVKLAVCQVAKPEGAEREGENKIYGNNCDEGHRTYADDSEWLFDLVWALEDKKESWQLRQLNLVMESEWGRRADQTYDFQKLLVAKARIKLFVFQEESEISIDGAICEFSEMISHFRCGNSEEVYLFAGLHTSPAKTREFKFELRDSSGKIPRGFGRRDQGRHAARVSGAEPSGANLSVTLSGRP